MFDQSICMLRDDIYNMSNDMERDDEFLVKPNTCINLVQVIYVDVRLHEKNPLSGFISKLYIHIYRNELSFS